MTNIDKTRPYWFPMRVTYGREMKVKAFVEAHGVTCFLPMKPQMNCENGKVSHTEVPAISNLLFVNDSFEHILYFKHSCEEAMPLRWMTRPKTAAHNAPNEVMVVPERQMQNFIKAASAPEELFTYLTTDDLVGKAGHRVVITSGPFKGVEGIIKRVHGNKRVVIELEGLGGLAINFVPKTLMTIQEE